MTVIDATSPTSSPRVFYQRARLDGLTVGEAGNLTAVSQGLRAAERHPWTLREVNALLFLRWLAEQGRVPA